ncbi:hypothetical protein ZIOFF_061459 [Zingiber officinale]|uniref:Uncharacterized protein n=1 Tax=Zingiber officinale TaxID=94328 RepID=A0A8J5EZ56_ZINOF|nr:hypothetical protein ZIOFF_061459 [Zingiber officinale]
MVAPSVALKRQRMEFLHTPAVNLLGPSVEALVVILLMIGPDGEPLILCFDDFATPAQAAISLEALQGYKFDENDRDSANLRLQFACFPGPRPVGLVAGVKRGIYVNVLPSP